MINYLDVIYFVFISVMGLAFYSMGMMFIIGIEPKEEPTYYKMEDKDIYVVYRSFLGRAKGYESYKFKKDGDKLVCLKGKERFPVLECIILGIFFLIALIKGGLLVGIAVLLVAAFIFGVCGFIWHMLNVFYCKRFLIKKLKLK